MVTVIVKKDGKLKKMRCNHFKAYRMADTLTQMGCDVVIIHGGK